MWPLHLDVSSYNLQILHTAPKIFFSSSSSPSPLFEPTCHTVIYKCDSAATSITCCDVGFNPSGLSCEGLCPPVNRIISHYGFLCAKLLVLTGETLDTHFSHRARHWVPFSALHSCRTPIPQLKKIKPVWQSTRKGKCGWRRILRNTEKEVSSFFPCSFVDAKIVGIFITAPSWAEWGILIVTPIGICLDFFFLVLLSFNVL